MWDKTQIQNMILNGATVADLAAHHNTDFRGALEQLGSLGIVAPNAQHNTAIDQTIRRYLGFCGSTATHHSAEAFVDPLQNPMSGFVHDADEQTISLAQVFEHFHGQDGYRDPYNGKATERRVLVLNIADIQNQQPYRNFLITNLIALSDETLTQRFAGWMPPIQETFWYEVGKWRFELLISKQYDRMVGGTYQPLYMRNLFNRWVEQPLQQYGDRSSEYEPVLNVSTPYGLAWWSWCQLTHYGLLKGLLRIEVSSAEEQRSATLRDVDMINIIVSSALRRRFSLNTYCPESVVLNVSR